jgi:hypothetical protein
LIAIVIVAGFVLVFNPPQDTVATAKDGTGKPRSPSSPYAALTDSPITINIDLRSASKNLSTSKLATRPENSSYANGALGTSDVVSGLIIKPEPLKKILSKTKTWEMRSKATSKRGRIALIEKGGKRIVGVASIINVKGPLSDQEFDMSGHLHGIDAHRINDPKVRELRFAWILSDLRAFRCPIPYSPRSGAVTFVNLTDDERLAIQSSL